MKLGLVGYGKLGKEIERGALERGWRVVFKQNSTTSVPESAAAEADVVIHAATPVTVVPHVHEWAARKKQIVIGTTGWYDRLEEVKAMAERHRIGIVYASNFSVGVQAFFQLVRQASIIADKFPEYDLAIREVHHKEKVDAPSGTAIQAGKILLESVKRKKEIFSQSPGGKIHPDQLQIASVRVGSVVGEHSVLLDSAADTIEIRHAAKNRSGYAHGALLAAEWIQGKRGLFTMENVLADYFK